MNRRHFGVMLALAVLATTGLGLPPAARAGGVLDPHGPIGRAERLILLDSLAVMLTVVVPVILATLAVAWWFRAGNARARRLPDWAYSGRIEFVVWSIPALIIMLLGGITWISSHDLDPYRRLSSSAPGLEVQVVSLDWKWLFIYPDEDAASVNRLVIPAGRPVHFDITSGTVMNSFFVPQLGSQVYSMAGMNSQLSLQADDPGRYWGLSAMFSGDGFSDMMFEVQALPAEGFAGWLRQVHGAGGTLDLAGYGKLLQPGSLREPVTFGAVSPDLYQAVLRQTVASAEPHAVQPTLPAAPER